MKYARIRPEGLNAFITPINDVKEYLENSQIGDKWEIEIIEMTEDDYSKLPELSEFNGF